MDINSRFTDPIEEKLFQSGAKPSSTCHQGSIAENLPHRRMSAMGSQMFQSNGWNIGNQEGSGYKQLKSGTKINLNQYQKQGKSEISKAASSFCATKMYKFLYLSLGNATEQVYLNRSSHERVEDKLLQSLSNRSIAKQQASTSERASQRPPSSIGSNRTFQRDAWNLYPGPRIGRVVDCQVCLPTRFKSLFLVPWYFFREKFRW